MTNEWLCFSPPLCISKFGQSLVKRRAHRDFYLEAVYTASNSGEFELSFKELGKNRRDKGPVGRLFETGEDRV
jgi:hypothetical protein